MRVSSSTLSCPGIAIRGLFLWLAILEIAFAALGSLRTQSVLLRQRFLMLATSWAHDFFACVQKKERALSRLHLTLLGAGRI